MDDEMNVYSKSIASTIFIFLIGLMVGILIDSARLSDIEMGISESDIIWEDTRLLNIYISELGGDQCQLAFDANLDYNNEIYDFGKTIEKEIIASTFDSNAKVEWNKYVLLQFQFWMNSIELKENCGFDYSNVVFISRLEPGGDEEMNSKLQSAILLELKEKCGSNMMLIPLTADSGLESIDLVLKNYDITELPAVIIDEEHVFQGLASIETLEEYVNC